MHIAQPALSHAIKKLEEYVGVELFARDRRGVALTQAGQVFLEQTYQTLAQGELAVERAQNAANGSAGHLSIGFIGSSGYGFMPSIIARFRDNYPGIDIRIAEMPTLEQLEQLENRQIDVGILRTPLTKKKDFLNLRLFARDRLMVAVHQDHHLAQRSELALAELADEPLVTFNRDKVPASYAQLMSACLAAGFHPRIAQECSQVAGVICVVAAGLGLAIIPSDLKSLMHPKVRYIALRGDDKHVNIELSLAWRKDDRNPVLNSFLASAGALSTKN